MKKKWIALLASGALLAWPATAVAIPVDDVDIYYNDTKVATTQPMENYNARLMLAFRDYFEGLNIPVDWNESTRVATVVYDGKTVLLEPDTGRIYLDGRQVKGDVDLRVVNDRIYVPLRFLSEIFDCTVEYTAAAADSRANVQITSKDAPVNYVLQRDEYTRILRKSSAPVSAEPTTSEEKNAYSAWQKANTAYYLDKDGHITEVTTYDDKLAVLQVDEVNGKENSTEYSSGSAYMTLGQFMRVGDHYQAEINASAENISHIGVGDTLVGDYVNYVNTATGQMTLYRSQGNKTLLDIAPDGTISFVDESHSGYALNASAKSIAMQSADYAIAANGYYGYLVDGELIIIDDRQEIVSQQVVSATMKDCHLVAYGNKFIIMGVESDNAGNGDFYTAIYDTKGNAVRGYFESSNITDRAYAQITSVAQQGDIVYALVHTSWYDYLATINVTANTAVVEQLPRYYQSIIATADGYALFCADKEYYYIQPLE